MLVYPNAPFPEKLPLTYIRTHQYLVRGTVEAVIVIAVKTRIAYWNLRIDLKIASLSKTEFVKTGSTNANITEHL